MSLLKQMVKEMASAGATSAHAVAAVPGGLFTGGVVDGQKAQDKSNRGKFKKMSRMRKNPGNMLRRLHQLGENLGANSGETDFSSSDVVSKMDAAEKKSKAGDDTTAFGMEDEEGNLVKVYVKTDSAEDFEKALAAMLAGEDENEDDANSALEIAEVLFKLKDKFEIVDVDWPEIEGDEEEEQEVGAGEDGGDMGGEPGAEGGEGDDLGLDGEDGAEGGEGDDLGLDGEDGGDMEADDGAASALDKVIDMMKADAEAKKAEADARTAEAKAKEADAVARASQAKVTQEEQILDMESHYKDKADQDKEAKQLAKMAKYKHDKAREAEGMMATESSDLGTDINADSFKYKDDESKDVESNDDESISKEELATLILKHLRHN